jgi:hypothetical protein
MDRKESLSLMEPLLIAEGSRHRGELTELAVEVAAGNGRVARLVLHASLLETLDTGGIWSVARGLARNGAAYKSHLTNCDPRRTAAPRRSQYRWHR